MEVTILGNNSAVPAFGRHPTSQLLRVGNHQIMIDCGEGTQIQLQRYNKRLRNLSHILISHLHGDHYFGLPGILTSMALYGRTQPIKLVGPAPLKGILQAMFDAAGTVLPYELIFIPLEQGFNILDDNDHFTIENFQVIHRIECHGFLISEKHAPRSLNLQVCNEMQIPVYFYKNLIQGIDFEDGNGRKIANEILTKPGKPPTKYAYCADTIYTESILPYVTGAHLMYHESTFLKSDEQKAKARFHSTAEQAALLAKQAGVFSLLLGHFSSRYLDLHQFAVEARAIFPNTFISQEGETYIVG